MKLAYLAAFALPLAATAQAQAIKTEPPMRAFTEAEVAKIEAPDLAFEEDESTIKNYEKYFYFHRDSTSFDQAYADVTECDALSSGISYYAGANSSSVAAASAQYGLAAGAIGGAIAGVMMDAIFGSGERRKQRRLNIRNCMYFKGYDRYGLEKDIWKTFNFEEGLSRENAEDRAAALLVQAKAASGAKPEQKAIAP